MAARPRMDLGYGMVSLLANPKLWVRRRVETIHFPGEEQIRRSVSVDFDMDQVSRVLTRTTGTVVVPLALLAKRPLALLDVVDEFGAALPVLSTAENGFVAYSTLAAAASMALRRPLRSDLPTECLDALERIASAPSDVAQDMLDGIARSDAHLWRTLWLDPFFRKLAKDLASNFLLLTPVQESRTELLRRIFKYSFAIEVAEPANRATANWIHIAYELFLIQLPSIADAASYHIQIIPPPGLKVGLIDLYIGEPRSTGVVVTRGSHIGGIGHVHSATTMSASSGSALIELKASPRGILFTCCVTSTIITSLLATIAALPGPKLAALDAGVNPVLALLLTLPALIAVYFVSTGEPSLVTRILRKARLLLFASAMSAFIVSLAFALDITQLAQRATVSSAAALSLLCTLPLLISWLRNIRGGVGSGQARRSRSHLGPVADHNARLVTRAIPVRSSEGDRAIYENVAPADTESLLNTVTAKARRDADRLGRRDARRYRFARWLSD